MSQIKMYVDFTFLCGQCDSKLEAYEHPSRVNHVFVLHCEKCIENARNNGYDSGHEAGYEIGYETGHNAGYDAGFTENQD